MKRSVLLLTLLFSLIAVSSACAMQGEGYFGPDTAPFDIIPSLPSVTIPEVRKVVQPAPTTTGIVSTKKKSDLAPKHEKFSEKTEKVIRSYGLDPTEESDLLDLHHAAERARSKPERYSRYSDILMDNPLDYLAAFRMAQVAFDMANYSECEECLNTTLEICPDYAPAKRLMKVLEGKQY
ncbi:MAG: hypothetical protein IJG30_03485 [Synergistaceae bacterium]|nr:hypothetical protein [Synergistaceae bacterium]MBQ6112689.1 hypothetical protein [Synergistaceae bacterium]